MEKIWLKQYQAGVPATINPDAYSSLVELFNSCCQQFASNPAVTNMGRILSYRELQKLSRAFAAYLQSLGLTKGERFAIMLPNLLQYPVAMFGALQAGLTIVNVNPLYTPTELKHQLNDAGVSAILVLSNFAHTLQQVLPELTIKHVFVTDIGDLLSFPKAYVVNWVVKYFKKMVPAWDIPQAVPFKQALKQGKSLTFTPVAISGEDIAYLQYTGGTTGIAKGAILTHRNMVANVEQAFAWISPSLTIGKEIIITALPLYHIFSLTANCLVFMKLGSLNVLITNPRDINGFIKILKKQPFTVITGVNTLFNALAHHPDFAQLDFSQLHLTLGGGMAVQRVVAEYWQKITGQPLTEAYGLTETAPAVCINPLTHIPYNGSIGLPISSTDICLLDKDGFEVAPGDAGELCVKGPQVMRGYWNNPSETAKVFTQDGWLRTGDIACIDELGFVRIVDRKKDMIIVSGFNVYPNEIENVIASHPGVLEVAVLGMSDATTGEAVKAFVVRKDLQLTKEDLISFCRSQLTNYKVPKQIEFRDELPKTNVGKILRRALRESIAA